MQEQYGEEITDDHGDAQIEEHEEGQEEPALIDADSTDGAVLVNGNEADEEWGTNNEGKTST